MKKNKIIFWAATIVLILWEGVMPAATLLFAPEYVNAGTKALGYPDYFAYALIICKILGIVAISFNKVPDKIKEWAYAGLAFNLIFAFISHACVDGNPGYMLMPLVFLVVLMVSYRFRKWNVRKEELAASYDKIPSVQ
ncbi:DoxX family protein [Chryseobacterium sp. CKR4-1]|uniref:DoxX family protein n=1 Tax=Chryseobacterium sp. CKR4-1 TaxID=3068896 RepID=UPI002796ABB5|nr:DoxX family protein [Chryseobacterium sp. CKR4-1]MDQ1804123.1 DoxX family protein [Chryseobacterium sp. CKR4-1]